MVETARLIGECPHCSHTIEVIQRWEPGGVSDYGGYVLECAKCRRPFDFLVGRDIHMSRVATGAQVLETYDEAIAGSKERALGRYGISK